MVIKQEFIFKKFKNSEMVELKNQIKFNIISQLLEN